MDRLLSLRNLDANSSCNSNTSQSSEHGYETARDDSFCSTYYSMNDDDTVNGIDDDDLNVSGHSQQTVVPATTSMLYHLNGDHSSFVETGRYAQSSNTAPIEPSENLNRSIVSANSNVAFTHVSVAENSSLPSESTISSITTSFVETGRSTPPIEPSETLDRPIDSGYSNVAFTHTVSVAETSSLPFESTISSITTSYSSSVEAVRSTASIEASNSNLAFTHTASGAENSNSPFESTISSITGRENSGHLVLNSNLSSALTHTVPSTETLQQFGLPMIHNLLPILEVSNMRNGTNTYNSSTVQEINVVAVNNQQRTNEVPRQTRATRSTMVRFQTNDLPRRQTIMPRRTLRDTRNEVMPPNRPVVPAGPSNLGRKSVISTNHVCDVCKQKFPLRSTLIIHKTSHKTNCKYCDRTFKKAIALSNHLKENCEKIPAAARRKILTNEFKEKTTMQSK